MNKGTSGPLMGPLENSVAYWRGKCYLACTLLERKATRRRRQVLLLSRYEAADASLHTQHFLISVSQRSALHGFLCYHEPLIPDSWRGRVRQSRSARHSCARRHAGVALEPASVRDAVLEQVNIG
ncbi:hypothetical protein E2C01_022276 [Portunus trituberculatus]|uniref:Uncharacterized protein n=1 Tax=Portunus trituberculatus TaxID=210409 RepID=A0A5B7E4Y5_PORTR|nr:hypothetical protein [Portunus trituberculatus]